ncbi:TetR-like C-terminal domain-containing protein [Streptomyces asiaticus]|uniref:TetR-like C-terminal domain-containing protein n=1 Tax=Streptomyces asiaticus TaxID=114695 RepID=UPI003822EAE2
MPGEGDSLCLLVPPCAFFRNPETPVRPWLRGELFGLAAQLRMPEVVATAGILMQDSLWDPEIINRRDVFVGTLTGQLRAVLDLALDTAELDTRLDPHDAAALLIGPIPYRTVMQGTEATDDLIDHLLDSQAVQTLCGGSAASAARPATAVWCRSLVPTFPGARPVIGSSTRPWSPSQSRRAPARPHRHPVHIVCVTSGQDCSRCVCAAIA